MLKFKLSFDNFFESRESWLRNRRMTLFRSERHLHAFQQQALERMRAVHGVDPRTVAIIDQIPPPRECNSLTLMRAGTTSSLEKDRLYRYSLPHYEWIEEHHFWKIEQSHGISEPGSVVWISTTAYPYTREIKAAPPVVNDERCTIYGPVKYLSVGSHNDVYEFFYNSTFSKDAWQYNLEVAEKISAKFFRCSPSVLEAIYFYEPTFRANCPVVTSEETLTNRVRLIAERMFTKTIDKMVCWDGMLGWFECSHGRKHIYDELALVEEINGDLISTDLHNEAMPFFRYRNRDRGRLEQGMCGCGIYGNFLAEFEGKTIESVFAEGKVIPGRLISENLSLFFRTGCCGSWRFGSNSGGPATSRFENFQIVYRLRQKVDQSIEFIYCGKEMSAAQIDDVVSVLNWIIYRRNEPDLLPIVVRREAEDVYFKKADRRSKSLFVESDYIKKTIYQA